MVEKIKPEEWFTIKPPPCSCKPRRATMLKYYTGPGSSRFRQWECDYCKRVYCEHYLTKDRGNRMLGHTFERD